jgi:hypothetical protein
MEKGRALEQKSNDLSHTERTPLVEKASPVNRTVNQTTGADVQHSFPSTPWTRRDIVGALAAAFAVVVYMLTLTLLLGLWLGITGRRVPPGLTGIISLLGEFGFLLLAWLLVVRRQRQPWSSLGFRRFDPSRSLGLGCLFLLIAYAFNFVWSIVLYLMRQQSQSNLLPLFGSDIIGLLLALLVLGVVAPIAEEAFYRGFLFAGLRSRMGFHWAVVFSAVVFAFGHLLPTSWPPIFVLGVLFASLYEQTGSIWPSIILHATINSVSLLLAYLQQVWHP